MRVILTGPRYVPAGAILPLLAAKQRAIHPNDWMSTDAEVACPDPNCKSRLRITRTKKRIFRHGDVTVVPRMKEVPVESATRKDGSTS